MDKNFWWTFTKLTFVVVIFALLMQLLVNYIDG